MPVVKHIQNYLERVTYFRNILTKACALAKRLVVAQTAA